MTLRRIDANTWENPATREADPSWTLPGMLRKRLEEHPGEIAIEIRGAVGQWQPMSIDEFVRRIDDTARGLIGMGIRPGDRVAILAPTSFHWALLDYAALSCGAITVPIYETDSAQQIDHIIKDARVCLVLTATSQQADLVRTVAADSIRILALDRGAEREIAAAARTIPVE